MSENNVPTIKTEAPAVQREVTRTRERFASPDVDIFETADGLSLVADLPGVEKSGLKITVEDDLLTIEGKVESTPQKGYQVKEFEPVSFFRQFEITDTVDREKITADLKNGVLTLSLPRSEAMKPRQIEVSVS